MDIYELIVIITNCNNALYLALYQSEETEQHNDTSFQESERNVIKKKFFTDNFQSFYLLNQKICIEIKIQCIYALCGTLFSLFFFFLITGLKYIVYNINLTKRLRRLSNTQFYFYSAVHITPLNFLNFKYRYCL